MRLGENANRPVRFPSRSINITVSRSIISFFQKGINSIVFTSHEIINTYNKLQEYITKIDVVESIIDDNLRSKYDNINKCVSLIRGNDKISEHLDKNMFEEIVKLRNLKISNFDLDRKLIEAATEFTVIKEKYKDELNKSEEIKNISKRLEEIDEKLDVNREYYNRNIAEYNKLIKMFPTNIIAKIYKYEEKLFYDKKDMSDDDYNDFKL